jgi:uncharacterized protein YgiM (DUF1202 family)
MSKNNYRNSFVSEPTSEEPVVESVVGVVFDCSKLNVRKYPYTYADVRCVIKAGDKVTVDEDGSTDLFYKVKTESGVDGYCMRQYIEV